MEQKNKSETSAKKATVIPVASGKGGVGKSTTAANLAIALAQLGCKTVIIDLDLGSSNLHFMLGMSSESQGIGDYIGSSEMQFESLGSQTEWPNLRFIPGEGKTPFLANISYNQKVNLIKKIKDIPADYVILDLSAGSSFNVLDFFSITEKGILVTTPDRVSAINMLSFLKQLLLRRIDRAFVRNGRVRELVSDMYQRPINEKQIPISTLIDQIKKTDEMASTEISRICSSLRPLVIYNMLHESNDLKIVGNIDRSADKILSLKLNHFAAVLYDKSVLQSINKGVSLLKFNPDSPAAQNIFSLAGEIVHNKNQKIEQDYKSFIESTLMIFDKFKPAAPTPG